MLKALTLVLALLFVAPAKAQQAEQLYRNINSALAQDNARLGAEITQLQEQVKVLKEKLDAKQKPEAGPNDGGSSPQPGVR